MPFLALHEHLDRSAIESWYITLLDNFVEGVDLLQTLLRRLTSQSSLEHRLVCPITLLSPRLSCWLYQELFGLELEDKVCGLEGWKVRGFLKIVDFSLLDYTLKGEDIGKLRACFYVFLSDYSSDT